VDLKFLGIQIDNHLNLKNHIDQIIPKVQHVTWLDRYTVFAIMTL
jgi:hypothetical protein